ncbi:(2Fe-2S)-binding protein [Saccharibacillus alkalitolerans]|uniref:(2Fe-2S)-binding protein n=1 Tax=Saccharibacillus alkalitolerans TaxID=2705290 RepID=A0ABX0F1C0_9BACL|nr:(2Fe-2S)-binding protein [Saccharibacillus alkalitolerans]NGZ74766.1 (2Fe-2S)-binding protein [Saccharibacillus alkalitolerans]
MSEVPNFQADENGKSETKTRDSVLDTELLPQFYMSGEPSPGAEAEGTLAELSTPEGAEAFLRVFADILQAPDLQAAVTYFCSWFSGTVSASVYFPAAAAVRPDFSADNLVAQLFRLDNGGHAMRIVLGSRSAEPAPQAEEAFDEWTLDGFRSFYGRTCRELFENFSRLAGLPVGMIWAQLPGRLYYFAGTWRSPTENGSTLEPHRERLERAYGLLKTLEPETFGRKKNPFDLRFRCVEHPTDPSQTMQLRPSCCLYHTLPGADFCYNCPKLNERDRAERRERMRAQ